MHPRRIRKLSYLFSVHLCLQHGISKHTKQFSGIRGSDDIADQLRREIRHIIIMRGSPQPLGWCEESEAACSFSGTLYIKHKNLSHSHTRSKPLYFNNQTTKKYLTAMCSLQLGCSDFFCAKLPVQQTLSTIEVSIDLIDSDLLSENPDNLLWH